MEKQVEPIPNFFKRLRKSLNINQEELASELGIDRTYLSRIENGHVEPSIRLIRSAEMLQDKLAKSGRSREQTSHDLSAPIIPPALESDQYYERMAAQCIYHIVRYTTHCLKSRPKRIAWVLEELNDRFPLSYFDALYENEPPEKSDSTDE